MLSHVSIERSAGSSKHAAWRVRPDILADTSLPCFRNTVGMSRRISKINQLSPSGAPSILERDQSRIVTITATHVEFAKADPSLASWIAFQSKSCVPPKLLNLLIGATILVNKYVLVAEGEDARNWAPILRCNSNLGFIAQRKPGCFETSRPVVLAVHACGASSGGDDRTWSAIESDLPSS